MASSCTTYKCAETKLLNEVEVEIPPPPSPGSSTSVEGGGITNPYLLELLSMKRGDREAFQQSQPKYRALKRDGVFTNACLPEIENYPNYNPNVPWVIKFLKLYDFKKNLFPTTFQFILSGEDFEEEYLKFYEKLKEFYSPWNKTNFGLIPEDKLESEKYKYAVVYVIEYDFYARVRIEYPSETDKRPEPLILEHIDSGTVEFHDFNKHKLFYLHKDFIELVRQTNSCTLDRTLPFIKYSREFRLSTTDILKENQNYVAHLKRVVTGIAVLDLMVPGSRYIKVSEQLIMKAIETFETPQFPKVGKILHHCYFSNIQEDGIVHVQNRNTLQYAIFKSFQDLPCMKKVIEFPPELHFYKIKKNVRYLAKYEDWYYRCVISPDTNIEATKDEFWVDFIDYGNSAKRKKNQLVPCSVIDKEFDLFPPQAFVGQLNMKDVDVDEIFNRYDEKISVMTIAESSPETNNLPLVEIFASRLANPTTNHQKESENTSASAKCNVTANPGTCTGVLDLVPITQDMVASGHAKKIRPEISEPTLTHIVEAVGKFELTNPELKYRYGFLEPY